MGRNKPLISIIAAMSENRVIGSDGRLPWHVPADLKRFKELTMGHPLIMGQKTFQSIGRPLPGRPMIVLSRQSLFYAEGCMVAHDLEEALRFAGDADEIFICGGEEVFRQTLHLADRVYLTVIHADYAGDAYFPQLPSEFIETAREHVPGLPSFSFINFERLRSP